MKIVAFASAAGGSGRTSVVAALTVLLAQRALPVVSIELDAQNLLGTFLGLSQAPALGFSRQVLEKADPWKGTTYRSGEGALFVPFGAVTPRERLAFEAAVDAEPQWLSHRLAQIDLPAHGIVLLDTARSPDPLAAQALACADQVLWVTRPDSLAVAALAGCLDKEPEGRGFRVLVNGLHPAYALQKDVLVMLRARIGSACLLDVRIHQDESVPGAYALGEPCTQAYPQSQASHDYYELADWLCGSLGLVEGL